MAEILEAIMVICFGVSWPISITKSLKTKSSKGKSPIFLSLIIFGYASGIASKIVGDNITYVFYFYILNLVMVGIDLSIFLYFKNKEKNNKIEA